MPHPSTSDALGDPSVSLHRGQPLAGERRLQAGERSRPNGRISRGFGIGPALVGLEEVTDLADSAPERAAKTGTSEPDPERKPRSVPAGLDEIADDRHLAQGATRLEAVQSFDEDEALAVLSHENRRFLPGFHDAFGDCL